MLAVLCSIFLQLIYSIHSSLHLLIPYPLTVLFNLYFFFAYDVEHPGASFHMFICHLCILLSEVSRSPGASQVPLVVKNLPANAGDIRDTGSIPGSEKFPGEGNGNPLQYSCLENSTDRGAQRATVHRVTKSWT